MVYVELGTAAAVFSVYLATLAKSIAGGDSGELVAEGCILGVAHPPGYPLFTLLVNALSKFAGVMEDGRDVAYVVNISSAFFTAGATYCIGRIIRILTTGCGVGAAADGGVIFGMGTFALSPLIWQYAVTAEVFPLNTFFAAWIALLVLQFATTGKDSIALIGALVCGLAFTNQHTIVLYEIPLILYMLLVLRRRLIDRPLLALNIGVSFLCGFAMYIYMPMAQTLKPEDGSWGDVTSVAGFIHHFLRRDYGTLTLFSGEAGRDTENMWVRHGAYLMDVGLDQCPFFVIPALATLAIFCCRTVVLVEEETEAGSEGVPPVTSSRVHGTSLDMSVRRKAPVALVVAQAFYFMVFHALSNLPLDNRLHFGIHQRFWMQPNVLTFALAGAGFSIVLCHLTGASSSGRTRSAPTTAPGRHRMHKPVKKHAHAPRSTPGKASVVDAATERASSGDGTGTTGGRTYWTAVGVAVLATLFQGHTWLFLSDQSENDWFRRYAMALLTPLPPNAVYLINYDQQWTSVRYAQKCLGVRPDVTSINLSMMTYTWFKHKHDLYPDLTFPGGSLSTRSSPGTNATFSLSALLRTNAHRSFHLSGKLSAVDAEFDASFDPVPLGLTSALVARSPPSSMTARQYRATAVKAWRDVRAILPVMPDTTKYSEVTWEWTIGRDLRDRLDETAAYLLEKAIADQATQPELLIDAMYFLESAIVIEEQGDTPVPWTLLKNAGLAHFHIAKNKGLGHALLAARGRLARHRRPPRGMLALPTSDAPDLFGTAAAIGWPGYEEYVASRGSWGQEDGDGGGSDEREGEEVGDKEEEEDEAAARVRESAWRSWSATRFTQHWQRYVDDEDARAHSPEYATISQMLQQVLGAGRRATDGP